MECVVVMCFLWHLNVSVSQIYKGSVSLPILYLLIIFYYCLLTFLLQFYYNISGTSTGLLIIGVGSTKCLTYWVPIINSSLELA